MNILVTGSAGMIGGYVVRGLLEKGHSVVGVDRVLPRTESLEFRVKSLELGGSTGSPTVEDVVLDLGDKEAVERVFEGHRIDRCIHLAALAHTKGVADTSWEAFKKVNVDCAVSLFEVCAKHNMPVLFISTVDAIGMVKGLITPETELNPISNYGKSKAMAEGRLMEICSRWNIYRFSPVYTEDVKRDIQKRYYLKYPDWAFLIGGGQQFEVLNVKGAVAAMVDWVDKDVDNTIHIIKDEKLLDSAKVIAEEQAEGRAKHVLRLPRWMVVCGYYCIKLVFGKSNKTYLVFKALWPFRTTE